MRDTIQKVTVPPGVCGDWRIERVVVDARGMRKDNLIALLDAARTGRPPRLLVPGTYTRLMRGSEVVMSDTPAEMREHEPMVQAAHGQVLIHGLGLGMVAAACLDKPEVAHVTVLEVAPDVIGLVGAHYQQRYGTRVTIIEADAFIWEPPPGVYYDAVWSDIWPRIEAQNLVAMHALRQRYRDQCTWHGFWAYMQCIGMAEFDRREQQRATAKTAALIEIARKTQEL